MQVASVSELNALHNMYNMHHALDAEITLTLVSTLTQQQIWTLDKDYNA